MSLPSQSRALWAAVAGVPLLFAAIALLQTRIDARARTAAEEKEELVMSSPFAVRKLSLGYDSLLGDIYWTRAVQYYGSRVGTRNANFDLLWPLLDITTTLDPKLIVAYRFGAIFLSEKGAAGAGRTDLAIKLVKRGIVANPDDWQLDFDLGFLYYWRMKDYPNAALAYLEASKNPKAPPWLKLTALSMATKGGSLKTSELIWAEIYESNQSPQIRKMAFEQLRVLRAQEDEQHLDELAADYRQKFGRYPTSTSDLRDAGILPGIPLDPDGYPYVFGPEGKSGLNAQSTFVIPPEPKLPSPKSK
ncbi:MAG: hypothetical protein ABSE45_13555 [Candidatus Acidiferrales bacterium]|jgi:hypothetical protein